MVTHEITFRILLTPPRIRLALLALVLFAFPRLAATADIPILETYYPPPSGSHEILTVKGETVLARDEGKIVFGHEYNDNVRVGVAGDAGKYHLRIHGSMKIDGCIGLQNASGNFRCHWKP